MLDSIEKNYKKINENLSFSIIMSNEEIKNFIL